jgi:protein-S-isoprenylcysteine O-methyltransferase Ste14
MNDQAENSSMAHRAFLACGKFFFKHRNGLFPFLFAVLVLVTRPALFMGSVALDRMVVALGVVAALAGQALRLAVIGYAYIKRGGREGKVYAADLVVRGFYAHSRNPMYVGNFLIAVGLGLVFGSPWVYAFVIPFFSFAYLAITAAEEAYLRAKFGPQYEAYERSVNRFIPNFRGLGKSLEDYSYDWRKALSKEYGTVFGCLLGMVVLSIWKQVYLYGYASRKPLVLGLAALLVPIFIFYAVARFLKVTKRLVPRQAG